SEAVMAAIAGEALVGEYAGPWSAGTSARWLFKQCVSHREIAGGPAALVRALEKSLIASGGTLRLNARVEKLLTGKGRVGGVQLEGGETLTAPLVGLSAHPRALLSMLPPHALPLKVFDELAAYRSRGTAAKVHLALDAPLVSRGR